VTESCVVDALVDPDVRITAVYDGYYTESGLESVQAPRQSNFVLSGIN
jgi:hypothetical protein